jgi:hypothetical protein
VLNGAFAELLVGQAPFVLPKIRRVLARGDPNVKLDFTTMVDTATFTAVVALDPRGATHVAHRRQSGDGAGARRHRQAKLDPLDNDRYPDLVRTSVREVMASDARLQMGAKLAIVG